MPQQPPEILEIAFKQAMDTIERSQLTDQRMKSKVDYIARNLKNRAGVRLLMSCLLAKIHLTNVDVRKPYTEIGDGSFSGRT